MSMPKMEDLKRKMLHKIMSAPDVEAAISSYSQVWWALPEYKIVFGSSSGGMPGFAVNREFSGGARVRSLFSDEHVTVLDPETIKLMHSGKATYPIDYSISLDTNAFSYLRPYVTGNTRFLPNDFVEVFDFIARDDVHVDGLPYLFENLGGANLKDEKKAAHVFDSLKAYEVLRTIDGEWLRKHGEVRSKLGNAALIKRAQESMSRLYSNLEDSFTMQSLHDRFNYIYVNLLQLALIQLQRKTWSTDRKLEAYIEFCHTQLATISIRDMVLGREYFKRGQNLKFFGRIQSGHPDLLNSLKNMAWDLFHIRQLESAMTMRPDANARYFFPALLTFDQDLVEIMDLCPLNAIAFTSDEADIMPMYRGGKDELISLDPKQVETIKSKYFSTVAIEMRSLRRVNTWDELPSLIEALETHLVELKKI
jgi:hypothetical protein